MAFVKGAGILAAALALIMLMSFWAAGRAREALDDTAREKLLADGAAYSFVDLPEGTVHYRLEGPEAGPLVVLVHGFSTPSPVWDDYFTPLTEAGYRVLAYDNFGRGLSSRPDAVYDAELFDRQLAGLLEALNVNRRIDLVGYSMGGAIATVFTARHPDLVRSLTLIAPAGLGVAANENVEMLKRPLIGDWIVRLFGTRLSYRAAAEEARNAGTTEEVVVSRTDTSHPQNIKLSTMTRSPNSSPCLKRETTSRTTTVTQGRQPNCSRRF